MIAKKDLYIFYGVSFFMACTFMLPVWYFFFTLYHSFGLSTAIFLGIFSGVIQAIFEVPSGAWADRIGRKKIFLMGILLYTLSFGIYIIGHDFWHFIVLGIIYGVGAAMTSGNIEAMIHDSLGKSKKSKKMYEEIQSTQYILLFIGRAFSCFIAGYLFLLHPLVPIIASIICYVIAFLLFLLFSIPEQKLSYSKNNSLHIRETIDWFSQNKQELYMLIFGGFLFVGIGNIYWFSYQEFFHNKDIAIHQVGIIYSIIAIISAAGSYTIGKIQSYINNIHILQLLFVSLFMCSIGLSYFIKVWIMIPIIILAYIFGFIEPLVKGFLIQNAPITHKSTIFSIFSLIVTLGYFTCSMIASMLAEKYGLEKVYFYLILIVLLLIIIDHVYIQRKIKI